MDSDRAINNMIWARSSLNRARECLQDVIKNGLPDTMLDGTVRALYDIVEGAGELAWHLELELQEPKYDAKR